MARWYGLDLSTKLNAVSAIRLLAERLDIRASDETHLTREGILIWAKDVTRGLSVEVTEGAFHFTPTLYVGFEIYSDLGDYKGNKRLMIRATMLLLENSQDAVLLFNGEETILQRILGGRLILNEGTEDWDTLEGEVYLPHERRPIPSYLMNGG